MLKRNCILGAALFAFALLGSQIARADDEKPVNLIVTPKVGRVVHTKTVIKTNVAGMDVVVNTTQTDTVKEVKEKGDFVIETVVDSNTVEVNGAPMDQPAAQPRTVTYDKFGKVTESKDDGGEIFTPEVAKIMTILSGSLMTDKAVKTSDTWQNELENPAVKAQKIVIKDTYLGIEKVDGKDCWKIKQTADVVVDPDGSKIVSELTQWINPMDGGVVKAEGTLKDVPTKYGAVTMQLTSKAVKPDDKGKADPVKP